MENWPINPTDLGVITIILISGLLALLRGFVKEMLSVGAWVGAAVGAIFAFPYVQPYARDLISIPFAADASAAVLVFLVTLVVLSAITHWIARHVRQSHFSRADRLLGLVFGVVRGAIVICLLWLLIDWAVVPEKQPKWITEARSLPLIQQGATMLAELVPEDIRARGAAALGDAEEAARDAVRSEADRQLDSGLGTGNAPTGYDAEERDTMDKLIESNQ